MDEPMGTVQIVIGQPENQAHRADVSKLLVHRDFRRQGIASKLMAEVDVVAAGQGGLCWSWIPRREAMPSGSICAQAGRARG